MSQTIMGEWWFHLLCILYSNAKIINMHKYWGAPLFFEAFVCSYHNIFCSNCLFLDSWLLGFSCNLFLQFLNPQCSLISLLIFINGYVHLNSLILWEMHKLWGSSYYIDLLAFSSHFGNRCQWGRSLEGLREFGFML